MSIEIKQVHKLSQQLVDEDPHNDKRSMELMTSLAHVGQIDKAAGIADRFNAGPRLDNELRLEIARCYAQCARGAQDGQARNGVEYAVTSSSALRPGRQA